MCMSEILYIHCCFQEEQLRQLRISRDYLCGDGAPENSEFCVKRCLSCSSEVETTYYSASLRHFLPPVCIFCGKEDGLLNDDVPYMEELYANFSTVRPLCEHCRGQGKEAKTWGRKFFKKPRKD